MYSVVCRHGDCVAYRHMQLVLMYPDALEGERLNHTVSWSVLHESLVTYMRFSRLCNLSINGTLSSCFKFIVSFFMNAVLRMHRYYKT